MKEISAEVLLLYNFIKYDELTRLTNIAFKNSSADNVNIYIDLYQIFLPLYQNNVVLHNNYIITSSILNLCAHMRSYFRTRHKVESKIFLIYSDNNSTTNTDFLYNYNSKNIEKMKVNITMREKIKNNVKLLETVSPYLPDIHFLHRSVEPGVVIYDCICKEELRGNINPNIILSRSTKQVYNFQIPALNKNTVIYLSRKSFKSNTDDTILLSITNSNALDAYIKCTRDNVDYNIKNLNSGLLSLLITLTNLPSRSVTSIMNIKSAINLIQSLISQGAIVNGHNINIEDVILKIPDANPILINRFKAIDILYQSMIYMNLPESKDSSYLLNLIDDNTIRSINDEYFKDNPIDLNRL